MNIKENYHTQRILLWNAFLISWLGHIQDQNTRHDIVRNSLTNTGKTWFKIVTKGLAADWGATYNAERETRYYKRITLIAVSDNTSNKGRIVLLYNVWVLSHWPGYSQRLPIKTSEDNNLQSSSSRIICIIQSKPQNITIHEDDEDMSKSS